MTRMPIIVALFVAIFWGVWWVPMRLMADVGLTGVWPGVAMSATGAVALLVPLAFGIGSRLDLRTGIGSLMVGVAITLYSGALNFTDVVAAVVLFYLAPAWSTLIECIFLGRRWNRWNAIAISLSLAGMLVIVGGDFSLGGFGIGEIMALVAGLGWSAGCALIFTASEDRQHPMTLAFASTLGALVTGLIIGLSLEFPTTEAISDAAWLAVAAGVLYLAPLLFGNLWAAIRLPPALLSFLLTAEIISGVVTSSIFLDESFGLRETLGALLVAAAALIEIRSQKSRHVLSVAG